MFSLPRLNLSQLPEESNSEKSSKTIWVLFTKYMVIILLVDIIIFQKVIKQTNNYNT